MQVPLFFGWQSYRYALFGSVDLPVCRCYTRPRPPANAARPENNLPARPKPVEGCFKG